MVVGNSKIRFPLVIYESEQDMKRIELGPQGWYTTELQEMRQYGGSETPACL